MIPKKPDAHNPLNFRPMSCLSNIYKILTDLIIVKTDEHCEQNNILAEEQKGCCQNSPGCKDLVTFDSIAEIGRAHV